MAMSEAERSAARKEAYKRWYAKKRGKAAVNKAAKPAKPAKPAKKVELKKTVRGTKPKAVKAEKDPSCPILEAADKLVKKNAKAVNQVKALMKDAAVVLADAFKTENEKLIASVLKTLGRGLSIQVDPQTPAYPDGKAKKVVRLDVGAKLFRVPKRKADPDFVSEAAAVEGIAIPTAEPDTEAEEEPKEVLVDPATAEKLRENPDKAPDILSEGESDEDEDEDKDLDAEETDEDDDVDEDDLDDEEKEARAERHRRREEEDELEGRAEAMAEFDAQGAEWGEQ